MQDLLYSEGEEEEKVPSTFEIKPTTSGGLSK